MKTLTKVGLVGLMLSTFAVANWIPGTVHSVLQNGDSVVVYIERTDNNTVIHRSLPSSSEKNMLAMLLTAQASGKSVSCNVNGAIFDKCFIYTNPPSN